MIAPTPSDRWKKLVPWLSAFTTLAYAFSRFVPCSTPGPAPVSILDESWVQTLHFAFEHHLQFGRDIVFTFGPWGFLCGGYYPTTWMLSVTIWIVLSFVFWWCLWLMSRHFMKDKLWAWLWMVGCIGVTGLPVSQNFDIRLDAWILLLLFLHFFTEGSAFSLAKILLVTTLGLLGLTKFTELMMTTGIVLIIAADDVLRCRRFPWLIVVFGFSVIFFWLAAGQSLSSFGPFLSNSWQIAGGYTEAMMSGAGMELLDAGIFWLAAVAACVPIVWAAYLKHSRHGILLVIGLGLILFVVFKHGFVRNDQHESEVAVAVLLTAMMGMAAAWPVLRSLGERARLTCGILGIIVLTYATVAFNICVPEKGLFARFAETLSPRDMWSPTNLFCNANNLKAAYDNRLAEIRDLYPLPELSGGVDVYPWDQVIIFAHDWHYAPRPVFQSYSAYTPGLAEMNADHLRSRHAADNLVFAVRPLDGRFPSLDDGCSWPELLSRYDVQGATKDFVLLKKSPAPREYKLVPLENSFIRFVEPVALPSASNGPIWIKLKIDKTPLGSLIAALYKPPDLTLTITLRNGRRFNFRLVPGMARSGFLLSPFINDNASFLALTTGDERHNPAYAEVASMSVSAKTPSGLTLCYRSPMRLGVYRLEFSRTGIKSQ
jgi:hypothetical protein